MGFCCNSAAVCVEPVETMDCMDGFPSSLLTVWTGKHCMEGVESLFTDFESVGWGIESLRVRLCQLYIVSRGLSDQHMGLGNVYKIYCFHCFHRICTRTAHKTQTLIEKSFLSLLHSLATRLCKIGLPRWVTQSRLDA